MSALAAVLFDMDGLLVDSEPVWSIAEVELATVLGGTFTNELKATIVGTRLEVAVPTMLRWYGAPHAPADVARTSAWLLGRMAELFRGDLPFLPGARELVDAVRQAGLPIALVSSSYRVLVDAVLAHGVGPFDLTLAGDEVVNGKPHPEPWLTAAAGLGVRPQDCVVVEDSPAGVASGEAAGCAVLAVPSVPGVSFKPSPRRLVRPCLSGLTVADLAALGSDAAPCVRRFPSCGRGTARRGGRRPALARDGGSNRSTIRHGGVTRPARRRQRGAVVQRSLPAASPPGQRGTAMRRAVEGLVPDVGVVLADALPDRLELEPAGELEADLTARLDLLRRGRCGAGYRRRAPSAATARCARG